MLQTISPFLLISLLIRIAQPKVTAITKPTVTQHRDLLRRRLADETDPEPFIALDPRTVQRKIDTTTTSSSTNERELNRRKFVSYQASEWEKEWYRNVQQWQNERKICHVLLNDHFHYLFDFLKGLCGSYLLKPYDNWCIIHESNGNGQRYDGSEVKLWFNTANKKTLDLTFESPVPTVVDVPPPKPLRIDDSLSHVFSKFTFLDEATGEEYEEYIEPLVSYLRFPLHQCAHPVPITPQYKGYYSKFAGSVVPPPPVVRASRALYFDNVSPSWDAGPGFFVDTWSRQGISMDELFIWGENDASHRYFDSTGGIPPNYISLTHYIASDQLVTSPKAHTEETPYLPHFINSHSTIHDYVVLKSSFSEEERFDFVKYLNSTANHVSELLWTSQEVGITTDLTLQQSYQLFRMLRDKGIRAHAWV